MWEGLSSGWSWWERGSGVLSPSFTHSHSDFQNHCSAAFGGIWCLHPWGVIPDFSNLVCLPNHSPFSLNPCLFFINEALLEHGHDTSCVLPYCCFCFTKKTWLIVTETPWSAKLKSGPLHKKICRLLNCTTMWINPFLGLLLLTWVSVLSDLLNWLSFVHLFSGFQNFITALCSAILFVFVGLYLSSLP